VKPIAPALWLSLRGVYAVLGAAAVLALSSAFPPLWYAFVAVALLVVALALADGFAGPNATSLRLRRTLPPHAALRRDGMVTYAIENRAAVAVRVGIVESPVPAIAFALETLVVRVAAASRTTAELAFVPRERGRLRFGATYLWVENRIGLLRRRFRVEGDAELRVFPDLAAVNEYGVLAKRSTLVDAGFRALRQRGVGTEFESLREYRPGDPFRLVDWKATARRGRTMVAQYEVERSQNVVIALDCGRLMTPRLGLQRKFDYALAAALSIARIAERADDNVGVLAFAARPLLDIAPRRGAAHVAALARATYDLQPRLEEPDYETTFATLARRHTKRSLIVLFTDLFDPVTSAAVLAGLATLVPRHLVMCVLMNDASISRALDEPVTDRAGAYRTAVAMTLADERATAVAMLRARGIIALDVPAEALTVAILDAYLDVKARGRL